MMAGNDAPQNNITEFLTGRFPTENIPLQQQFTQPKKLATDISANNTMPMVEKTAETKFGLPKAYQPTCWSNLKYCIPKVTPNVVIKIRAKNNKRTNLQ